MSTSEPVTSSTLNQKVREAVTGLGAIVFWEMNETKVTPDDLRAILARENIQIEVPDIDPESAVKRAARTWATGRVGTADKYRADVVDTGVIGEVKVCILHREETATGQKKQARWETVESSVFDLAARRWSATAWSNEVRAFVAMADDFIKFHDHNFIRPNIVQKRLVEMKAFSLKASSGLWYVTQDRMTDLAALQRVVGSIGSSQMYVIHVGATDSSRGAIQSAARTALSETLAELEEKLATWVESSRKIRSDAIDTTMGEFQELIDRATLYQDALQVRMDDLAAKITVVRDRARAIIDGNLTAHADPQTKPLGKRALQVLEAIESAYTGTTFSVRALEELLGATSGTLQTHLRDLARMGKVHREGKDEDGSVLFALGTAMDPDKEADAMDEVTHEDQQASVDEVSLVPAKERSEPTVEVEPTATVDAPIAEAFGLQEMPGVTVRSSVTWPSDEELAGMSRERMRECAYALVQAGIDIPKASKLGRTDLAKAIVEARDGMSAAG